MDLCLVLVLFPSYIAMDQVRGDIQTSCHPPCAEEQPLLSAETAVACSMAQTDVGSFFLSIHFSCFHVVINKRYLKRSYGNNANSEKMPESRCQVWPFFYFPKKLFCFGGVSEHQCAC